jgi:hypothetical protein
MVIPTITKHVERRVYPIQEDIMQTIHVHFITNVKDLHVFHEVKQAVK